MFRALIFAVNASDVPPEYRPLQRLVDLLPPEQIETARRVLEALGTTPLVPRVPQSAAPEDSLWMDTDLPRLGEFEPYDWGADGPPTGRPIVYQPSEGLIILETSGG